MSDEMERRLRETGEQLLAPYDSDTRAARTRFIEAATPAPKRRRRPLAAALVLAVAVASAFGVGYALASGGEKTRVVHEKQALDAGPGFLPAEGWRMTSNLAATAATAANASLGIRIDANFGGADLADSPPEALLPLQLDDATRVDASTRRLHVRVAAWDIDVRIHFDRTSTTALVAARHGQAAYYCGTTVADRTVEVDVVLPKLAQVSASLSQLTYFVARTSAGWTVWARAR
jgi:hypothetical protein